MSGPFDHALMQAEALSAFRIYQGYFARQTLDLLSVRFAVQVGFERLDRRTQQVLADAEAQGLGRVDCKAGCSFCCHQDTPISIPEALALVHGVPLADHAAVLARARSVAAARAGLSAPERYQRGIPCPLLVGRSCALHASRPGVCRSHFSLDVAQCRTSWQRHAMPNNGVMIASPAEPKAVGLGIMMALDMALAERGLEVAMLDLSDGLALALEEGIWQRWLDGERVFGSGTYRGEGSTGADYPRMVDQLVAFVS